MSDSLENKFLHLIRDEVRVLSAYNVQDAAGMIKLDAMENPYTLPGAVKDAWIKKLHDISFNRYPDPKAKNLSAKLRKQLNISENIEILFGNGSDEIIQMLAMAIAKPNAKILSIEPSFVMYKIIAQFCGLHYIGVSLNRDFSLDLEAVKLQIKTEQPALIFIAQPNNPTGNLFLHQDLCEIIELSKGLVVIDEAYTAFTEYNALPLLDKYQNLLVMRTFSKTGLAGLRLGYLLGNSSILKEIDKIRLPYNINILTQSLAECALDYYDLFLEQSKKIISSREKLIKVLSMNESLKIFPSEANFITLRFKNFSADEAYKQLKEQGVLVKLLNGGHPLLSNCLRLTVGTEEENAILISALENLH